MPRIPKNLKEAGIVRCDSAKDVKIFFHPASVKMWLTIAIAIIALSGSAKQAWDWTWYDFLKYPRNQEEKVIKHMTFNHLFTGEKPREKQVMKVRGDTCKLVSREYADGCVVTTFINKEGRAEGYKVHATAQTIAMLAKRFFITKIAEADYSKEPYFDFGVHMEDWAFTNYKGDYRGQIIREYDDKCRLSYYLDRYGRTYSWSWQYYQHKKTK